MTLAQLHTKRDEILQRIGVSRVQHGERSVQYEETQKALSLIDSEIARVTGDSAGTATPRTSYVKFGDR